MTIIPYDMERAVQAGIRLLDKRDPEWPERAKPESLDMLTQDLLTQLYESFINGIEYLGLGWPFWEEVDETEGWDHGFALPPWFDASTMNADYARLTVVWREQITLKRERGLTAHIITS